jgi:hypothetical protein
VPEYVEIESSAPANIYYTTDGTEPSILSTIYDGPVYLSLDTTNSITLSAFGVDLDGYSGPVLSQTFSQDGGLISVARLVNGEGRIVDDYSDDTNTNYGYDANGQAASFIDLTEEEVFNLTVRGDRGINGIGEGTVVQVNVPDPTTTANPYDDNFNPYTTTQYAATFDPYAKTIVIDNRLTNEVGVLLRPHGSFSDVYREKYGRRIRSVSEDACYVSGGAVRRLYNPATNTMCCYYFDHNEARWIKNIQQMPSNIPQTLGQGTKGGMVFTWIPRGKQSSNLV